MKLRELAERLGCRLEGDGDIEVVRVAGIQDAQPGDLTFLANPKYESMLPRTRASAVLLRDEAPGAPCAMLRTRDPYLAFARAVALFAPPWRPAPGVDRLAVVAAGARLGRNVSIGPFVVVGEDVTVGDNTVVFPNVTIGPGARIGSDCVIHSNVAIRERVVIGSRVILQNGVVVGADGYGFVRRGDGTHEKIPQIAGVVVEDDVELGANTTVDRPAVGETRIRSGTKIDNLVQIGHGVSVGRNVLMAAQVGVAGSTDIDDDVIFGGQVGVGGHLTVGRGSVAVGQSGVTKSLPPGSMVAGYPAIESSAWRKASVIFKRLPELKRRIEELEARLAALGAAGSGEPPT
ncbi:MAG: UDP-3-O-(3-hydroxymyristoyl)glucosamine N-acyltransferase [Acidobacteria bacterium RIFCSPLOWO2_02_FULL_68_18]|nr:MAG: UDP-3-O-(3-hydroxymyristoyl)glucosamine N-acyltransferase [Acidobacteria bacterium RIFCSPLOWO2_02_FULL_68_18]OFW51967.1 MAG: UDP-3-O-(3-hydroxymyristoyl)glucosamine N-acyltransferase [Acidobacteria bacterium RIFCSPLOWO2_12_FULL_68_19]